MDGDGVLDVTERQTTTTGFVVVIENIGTSAVNNITLQEQPREGVDVVDVDSPRCVKDQGIFCELGSLLPGASASVNIDTNADGVDPTSGVTTVTADGVRPIILDAPYISKLAAPPIIQPGGELTWTLQVVNPTGQTVSNVVVTDTIPDGLDILGVSASAGRVARSGRTITFNLPSLAPLDIQSVTIQTRLQNVDGNQVPRIRNVACMTTAQDATPRCAAASLYFASQLPATGESQFTLWRKILLFAVIFALAGSVLLYGIRRFRVVR